MLRFHSVVIVSIWQLYFRMSNVEELSKKKRYEINFYTKHNNIADKTSPVAIYLAYITFQSSPYNSMIKKQISLQHSSSKIPKVKIRHQETRDSQIKSHKQSKAKFKLPINAGFYIVYTNNLHHRDNNEIKRAKR